MARFGGRDRFAAYNGTAPVEVSSGSRTACRLSLRGNRRLNHAVHMAAVTQVSHRTSDGRACYDKKITQGKAPKEAPRPRGHIQPLSLLWNGISGHLGPPHATLEE